MHPTGDDTAEGQRPVIGLLAKSHVVAWCKVLLDLGLEMLMTQQPDTRTVIMELQRYATPHHYPGRHEVRLPY